MRVRPVLAIVVSAGLLAGACGGGGGTGGVPSGTALRPTAAQDRWVMGAMPPGYQWILMSAFLWNTSSEPIRLARVSLTGAFSSSVTVVRMEIARLPGTHARHPPYERNLGVVPGGLYVTYPPTVKERGEPCHVQELHPLSGYLLGRDQEARVLVWLRAVTPGPFRIDGHLVVYEQGGREYQQLLRVGAQGRIEEGASWSVLEEDPLETACSDRPGVRALNRR
ncbi:MAG: hypothetical protein ACRDHV_03120 [Actinomycetota bacterium]